MDEHPFLLKAPSCPWAAAAVTWPNAIGIVGPDGRTATWMDLHVHIEAARNRLAEMSEGPIGLQVSNSPADVVLLVAALRSGRHVALFGKRAPREAVDRDTREMGLTLVQSTIEQDPTADGVRPGMGDPDIDDTVVLTGSTLVRTSGTTGEARWIRHPAAAHVCSAAAAVERLSLNQHHRWGWSLPTHHVGGLSILWRCALAGAAVICQPARTSVATWLQGDTYAHAPTHLSLVPTQLRDILSARVPPSAAFRSAIVGGAALSRDLLSQAIRAGWPVRTTYGMTESASMVTLSDVWTEESGDEVHAGTALPGVDLSDPDGRLHVRTPALGHELADARGWFATSDRARQDSKGRWVIAGRMDRVIISGGENIDPARIEQAMRSLTGIEECIVVAVPDARFGQRPVAFVTANGPLPGRTECAAALHETLASFEIPDAILPLPPLLPGEAKWSHARLEAVARTIENPGV